MPPSPNLPLLEHLIAQIYGKWVRDWKSTDKENPYLDSMQIPKLMRRTFEGKRIHIAVKVEKPDSWMDVPLLESTENFSGIGKTQRKKNVPQSKWKPAEMRA